MRTKILLCAGCYCRYLFLIFTDVIFWICLAQVMGFVMNATCHCILMVYGLLLLFASSVQCFVQGPTTYSRYSNHQSTIATAPTRSGWACSSQVNNNMEFDESFGSNTRRSIMYLGLAALLPFTSVAAFAVEDMSSAAFAQVQFELDDPAGGVSTMQKMIDEENWTSLLDFTKTYDQVLRKAKMGAAKKLLPKDQQDAATLASNAVTFDLIGINRASRKGQESIELANKYLNELRDDVKALLALQPTVQR